MTFSISAIGTASARLPDECEKSWYYYIADKNLPEGEVVTREMPVGALLLINKFISHVSRSSNTED